MIRHFLGALFWSLVTLMIFINVFQFSGAVNPFEGYWNDYGLDATNSYFGFSSLIGFFTDLGDNSTTENSLHLLGVSVKLVATLSIDTLVYTFNTMSDNFNNPNFFEGILLIFVLVFVFFTEFLVLPVYLVGFVLVLIVVVLNFLFTFVTYLFKLMGGYYNVPLNSGILTGTENPWSHDADSWIDYWGTELHLFYQMYLHPMFYNLKVLFVN